MPSTRCSTLTRSPPKKRARDTTNLAGDAKERKEKRQALRLRADLEYEAKLLETNGMIYGNGQPVGSCARGIAECLELILICYDPLLIAKHRWLVHDFMNRFQSLNVVDYLDWWSILFRDFDPEEHGSDDSSDEDDGV